MKLDPAVTAAAFVEAHRREVDLHARERVDALCFDSRALEPRGDDGLADRRLHQPHFADRRCISPGITCLVVRQRRRVEHEVSGTHLVHHVVRRERLRHRQLGRVDVLDHARNDVRLGRGGGPRSTVAKTGWRVGVLVLGQPVRDTLSEPRARGVEDMDTCDVGVLHPLHRHVAGEDRNRRKEHRPEDGREDEPLRPHALEILTLDDHPEFIHCLTSPFRRPSRRLSRGRSGAATAARVRIAGYLRPPR